MDQDQIKKFSKKYCLEEQSKETKRHISEKHPSKFALMYYEVAQSMGLDENKCLDFARLVASIDNIYASFDGLVDSKLNSEQKIRYVQNIEEGYDLIRRLDRFGLPYEPVKKAFDDGIDLFMRESKITQGQIPFNEIELLHMLDLTNCDFQSITDLFLEYLPKERGEERRVFREFMAGYTKSDLICDHIVDLSEDRDNNSFNLLLWRGLGEDSASTKNYFVRKAFRFIEEAQRPLKKNNKLIKQLQFYLDGQREGLQIYEDNNYLIDNPQREELEGILLKPHPWENG